MTLTYRDATLDNGLTIIGELDSDAHTAAAGFFVRTGARDERPELMGVSHFLEHMMFKGTESLTAEELNRRFDAMGARNNAYTGHEVTCFHAAVLPERFDEATDLLSTMMRPALRDDDFDTERQVILEEIAMYKDDPFWVLYERTLEHHYGTNPLAHRVLGTNDTVSSMSTAEMRAYFEDRYAPDNMVVSLAGAVDFDAAVERIDGLCGSWTPTSSGRALARPEFAPSRHDDRLEGLTQGYVVGLCPAPGIEDDDRYAASLLAQVIGANDNSLLHWALVDTGLAEEAQAGHDPSIGCGSYFMYASGDPDRLDEIWAAIETAAAGAVDQASEDDLERLRAKLATAVIRAGERPADRMQRLGRLWCSTGAYRSLDEELERIRAVTLADLRRVAERFPLTAFTVGTARPA